MSAFPPINKALDIARRRHVNETQLSLQSGSGSRSPCRGVMQRSGTCGQVHEFVRLDCWAHVVVTDIDAMAVQA